MIELCALLFERMIVLMLGMYLCVLIFVGSVCQDIQLEYRWYFILTLKDVEWNLVTRRLRFSVAIVSPVNNETLNLGLDQNL